VSKYYDTKLKIVKIIVCVYLTLLVAFVGWEIWAWGQILTAIFDHS